MRISGRATAPIGRFTNETSSRQKLIEKKQSEKFENPLSQLGLEVYKK